MTKRRVDGILSADWHLRLDTPVCRTDDFQHALWKKVAFIRRLQKKHNCPLIVAGDLFDIASPPLSLLIKTMVNVPNNLVTVYGQHDLPNHNLNQAHRCGAYGLHVADKAFVLEGMHWGQNTAFLQKIGGKQVLVMHQLVWHQEKPYPGCKEPNAVQVMKKYKDADLIVSGDNHIPFVVQRKGQLLVNPGSLMRQDADQVDHKPRVYLWYASQNEVEAVYLPIKQGVISRDHIDKQKEKEDRISAFIEHLNTGYEKGLDFKQNMKTFLQENSVHKSVASIIWGAIDND